MLTLVLAVG
jgi:hypothetical protein